MSRFIYKRGEGALRRVMHLGLHDTLTGDPLLVALCGSRLRFDTSCNLPLGQKICRHCLRVRAKRWASVQEERERRDA